MHTHNVTRNTTPWKKSQLEEPSKNDKIIKNRKLISLLQLSKMCICICVYARAKVLCKKEIMSMSALNIHWMQSVSKSPKETEIKTELNILPFTRRMNKPKSEKKHWNNDIDPMFFHTMAAHYSMTLLRLRHRIYHGIAHAVPFNQIMIPTKATCAGM